MGYTHYYNFKESVDKFPDALVNDLKRIAKDYEDILEVAQLNNNGINLNGIEANGHETFYLKNNTTDFNFCKTARKEYDAPVCEMLLVLKHYYKDNFDLSSDGFDKEDFESSNREEVEENWRIAIDGVKNKFGYQFKGMSCDE